MKKHQIKNINTASLIICIIFLAVPFFFFVKLPLICLLVGGVFFWMLKTNSKGFSVLLIALSLSYPYSVTSDIDILSELTWWPVNIIRESIFLVFIVYYVISKYKCEKLKPKAFGVMLIIFVLSVFYSAISYSSSQEYVGWLNIFAYTYLFFYVVQIDKIGLSEFFRLLDVIMICTSAYVILEYFFNYSPYQTVYDSINFVDIIFRARGLLGHPLVLSSFILIYQATIYSRKLITNKKYYLLLSLSLVVGLLTASRTTLIVMILEFILFFIISGHYRDVRKFIWILISSSILVFSMIFLFQSQINDNLNRVENGNSDHRLAGYKSVFNLVQDYPFGVGEADLIRVIDIGGYKAKGLIKGFETLDNFYLTQIGSYGLFSIIIFYFYYYFLIRAFKNRKKNMPAFKSILIVYIVWSLLGFSFNMEQYLCISILMYGIISVLLKELESNKKIEGYNGINNNR